MCKLGNLQYLFEQQDGKCFYCDDEMLWTPVIDGVHKKEYGERQATYDHIKLKKDGGSYSRANGVCACWKCNTMRGDLPQDVFIEHRKFIAAEWELGNRNCHYKNGELISIPAPDKRAMKNKRRYKKRQAQYKQAGFIVALYAMHFGSSIEEFVLTYCYSTTYQMIEDTI